MTMLHTRLPADVAQPSTTEGAGVLIVILAVAISAIALILIGAWIHTNRAKAAAKDPAPADEPQAGGSGDR